MPYSDKEKLGNNTRLTHVAKTTTGTPIYHEFIAASVTTHHNMANRIVRTLTAENVIEVTITLPLSLNGLGIETR